MMVDPDGTLDALTSLGLTSPLAGQKLSPGSQQEASHPGAEALSSRPEGVTSEARGSSDHAEVTGRDSGPQQSPRSYN